MITRVVFNNKAFKIINSYGFKFSNNVVTFNDVDIDFTGYSLADIPYKYQEIKIMQSDTEEDILNGEILFTGYLDDIKLSKMKMREENREMTLTLLSPLKMATKRCVTLVGTYDLKTAVIRLVQPLIDDGFTIKEINVPDGQITTNYVLQTVEYCMNDIGFKRNIFWYINEKKEISINSIEYLFNLPIAKIISKEIKQDGFLGIVPTIQNTDYANVINFKNVRLIYDQNVISGGYNFGYPMCAIDKVINKGDIVNFDNPIIVDEQMLRNYILEDQISDTYCYSIDLELQETNGTNHIYSIGIDTSTTTSAYDKYVMSGNITFSDNTGEEGEIVLQRDSFFPNLITGFKCNLENKVTLKEINSDTALRYTTMRFMYSAEIEKLKGIISESGQIEKTVDFNEKWTTLPQLIEYARSLMIQNSNIVNQVVLEYDINPNLKIGDLVTINEPSFYIQGNFAVKDINYTYYNEIRQNWKITLKSTDFISTYIDMFRPLQQETPTKTIDSVVLSEFIEEQVNEIHSIELNELDHTLNFNL